MSRSDLKYRDALHTVENGTAFSVVKEGDYLFDVRALRLDEKLPDSLEELLAHVQHYRIQILEKALKGGSELGVLMEAGAKDSHFPLYTLKRDGRYAVRRPDHLIPDQEKLTELRRRFPQLFPMPPPPAPSVKSSLATKWEPKNFEVNLEPFFRELRGQILQRNPEYSIMDDEFSISCPPDLQVVFARLCMARGFDPWPRKSVDGRGFRVDPPKRISEAVLLPIIEHLSTRYPKQERLSEAAKLNLKLRLYGLENLSKSSRGFLVIRLGAQPYGLQFQFKGQ